MSASNLMVGVLLAGGESRRMGRDKGLLACGTFPTLLHRQYALLKQLPLDAIAISRHLHLATPEDLKPHVVVDRNQTHHDGPLAGLWAAIQMYPNATALLILPVDMPLMTSEHLRHLLNQGDESSRSLYYESHYFPLYLRLETDLRCYLQEQLETATGNRSVHSLLNVAGAQSVPVHSQRAFANTNTESEWRDVIETRKLTNE